MKTKPNHAVIETMESRLLHAAGDLNTGFSFDGKTTADIGGQGNYAAKIVVLADGKKLVAGSTQIGSGSGVGLVRLKNDGTIDTTFGTNGKVTTLFTAGAVNDMVVQADGKILVAGKTTNGVTGDVQGLIVRYTATGQLDTSFNGVGFAYFGGIALAEEFKAITVTPAGTIYAAGKSGSNAVIVWFSGAGTLMKRVDKDFGGADVFNDIAVAPDGDVVVIGTTDGSATDDAEMVLGRTNSSLTPDQNFDGDGWVRDDLGAGGQIFETTGNALAIQGDGKIVAAGEYHRVINGQLYDSYFQLARYSPDGSLDQTFDGGGNAGHGFYQDTPRGGKEKTFLRDVVIENNGKIDLVGSSDFSTSTSGTYPKQFMVLRVQNNGAKDTGFGQGGWQHVDFGPTDTADAEGYGAAIDRDGGLLVAGYAKRPETGADFAVAKLKTNTAPLSQIMLTSTDLGATEAGNYASWKFSRTGDKSKPLTVYYRVGGAAHNGTDYEQLTGSITIAAGNTTATLLLKPIYDGLAENAETVTITVIPSPAYAVFPAAELTATIAASNGTPAPTPQPQQPIVVDNDTAVLTGSWKASTNHDGYYGSNYLHDDNAGKGSKTAKYTPTLSAGTYQVFARWTAQSNRASNAKYEITHANGVSTVLKDQRQDNGQWVLLGTYTFNAGTNGFVTLKNEGSDGYVVADAVQFIKV